MGKVIAICTSPAKGTQKTRIEEGTFIEDFGIEGDAHAGKWHRQISLLSYDKIEAFCARGAEVEDGAFGENVIGAALVVAMAQGIMQVLGGSDPTTPTVINTIMYNISNALSGVSGAVAAVLMYLFQSVFNFFVVSGTGQAAITMPIMAPLSDLLGVSRQTAVVAFQLGDAFTNLIVPTSGCLIGSLAIAKIEWSNWIKFMWKFLGVLMIGAIITVLIAVGIGF